MSDTKQEGVKELLAEAREDLAQGRVRVINTCYACPFSEPVDPAVKEPTGNWKMECCHPATWIAAEPVKVVIDQHGMIPEECPLRGQPMLVFLDPIHDRKEPR